jgi:hypothetical protein
MNKEAAANAFKLADEAWNAELLKVFGKKSGPAMRYVPAGRGMHGSNLRKVYEAREAARTAWCGACGIAA